MSDIKEKIDWITNELTFLLQESNQNEGNVDDIFKKIESIKQDDEDSEQKYLRLYAEFDNYKRRSIKEKNDIISTASEKVVVEFLPIVDDIERSLEHLEGEPKKGAEMLLNKFKNTLETNNVIRMDSKGTDFNPELHQALTTVPNPEMVGKIIDVVSPGYTLGGKVIRYATVVVGE